MTLILEYSGCFISFGIVRFNRGWACRRSFNIVLGVVKWARMLCEKAVRRRYNVRILTDFDISGIAMCIKIPWAIKLGIDNRTTI